MAIIRVLKAFKIRHGWQDTSATICTSNIHIQLAQLWMVSRSAAIIWTQGDSQSRECTKWFEAIFFYVLVGLDARLVCLLKEGLPCLLKAAWREFRDRSSVQFSSVTHPVNCEKTRDTQGRTRFYTVRVANKPNSLVYLRLPAISQQLNTF